MPETRERQALRLIAVSFFALAGYVTFESLRSLAGGEAAAHSTVGIVLAALHFARAAELSATIEPHRFIPEPAEAAP